jgi:hypothetical protein
MQTINTWPDELELPASVKTALIKHLLEPFQTEAEATAYWQSSGTKLVVSALPENAVSEYIEALPEDYYIELVITDDSGSGVYYLVPIHKLQPFEKHREKQEYRVRFPANSGIISI